MSNPIRLTKGAEELCQSMAEKITIEASTVPKNTAEVVSETLKMSAHVLDQMKTMQEVINSAKPTYLAYVNDLRSLRMGIAGEVNASRKEFEDLRKFFLSADHEIEMARLREFIDVCERLKSLKESGFLDAISDTILKLA